MKNLIFSSFAFMLICACNSESGAAATNPQETAAKKAEKSDRGDKKWLIAIEGMPEKSGNTIVAATMGGNGNYSLGVSGFTASISYVQGEPSSSMMINFSKEAVRCLNKDGATAVREGDRAILSGEVLCYPKDGSFDDAKPSSIEGYFELKK